MIRPSVLRAADLRATGAERDLRALALDLESGEPGDLVHHAAELSRIRETLADADEEIRGDLTSPTWWAATLATGAALSEAAIAEELRRARVGRMAVVAAFLLGLLLGRII